MTDWMRHERMSRSRSQHHIDIEALLRSIHIRMDAAEPARIAHFRPTAKSVPLIEAMLARRDSRAWLVTAPYGTGKSLAAAYILHLVENRSESRPVLQGIESWLRQVKPSLARFAGQRRRAKKRGLVLVLDGYEPNLPEALHRSLLESMDRLKLGRQARPIRNRKCRSMREALQILDLAQEKSAEAGCDRCVILWDEFGRHLESLISEGRPGELADVQTLAEYVARSAGIPTTLTVLLHQRLLQYADRASHSVRSEWAKIEGRFAEHHFVDDSREIYRLLVDVIAARRPLTLTIPNRRVFAKAARQAQEVGWFKDWSRQEVAAMLEQAYPLEPATLALLPMISGRVAQNERTLFAFLYDQSLKQPLGPDVLYAYFAPAMRADVGVGGTHRRWLETESALSKTDDNPLTVRALTSACLLGLGSSGERARTQLETLLFAVAGYGDWKAARENVDRLLDKKLLLHRKHTDQISLWHGTDIDVRSRLEEAKARERGTFSLIEFINEEAPAPVWKPVRHNNAYDVRRYLLGEYCSVEGLGPSLDFSQHVASLPAGMDGRVLYVLAENREAIDDATRQVCEKLSHEQLLVAIPSEPVALSEIALDVQCLRRLQHDSEIIGEDPLAAAELEQFTDDARTHLHRRIQRLVWPTLNGPRWFYMGAELTLGSARELREQLSSIMDHVFSATPSLRNEMINRHRPARVLVNARKKVELGILERSGTPNLGLTGRSPDASIFRTILTGTGLYRRDETDRFRFAQPEEIEDEGLAALWAHLKRFFTEPTPEPKEPRLLIEELMSPPFGVRLGVLPVLISAAYQAFPAAVSITREGVYLEDILASEMEDLVRNPSKYRVRVLPLDRKTLEYLEQVYHVFLGVEQHAPQEGDMIRACHDAIANWQEALPPAALTSRNVGEEGRMLQQALQKSSEPTELLFFEFPRIAGHKRPGPEVVAKIHTAKEALESVASQYADQAAFAIRRILTLRAPNGGTATAAAREWAECFPNALVERLPEQQLSGLVTRLLTNYRSDRQLVDSLAFLLIGKPVQRWTDASLTAFERELDAAARRIEEIALSSSLSPEDLGSDSSQLARLAKERMKQWYARYRELAGDAAAQKMARSLPKQ